MHYFRRYKKTPLFIGNIIHGRRILYLITEDDITENEYLTLQQAFYNNKGTFIFSLLEETNLDDKIVESLIININDYISKQIPSNRAFLWMDYKKDFSQILFQGFGFLLFNNTYKMVQSFTVHLSNNLKLYIGQSQIIYDDKNKQIIFNGRLELNTINGSSSCKIESQKMTLALDSETVGCLKYDMNILQGQDFDIFNFGINYFTVKDKKILTHRYPIIKQEIENINNRVYFNACIDVIDLLNIERTYFTFTGEGRDSRGKIIKTILPTTFITNYGYNLYLMPISEEMKKNNISVRESKMVFGINPEERQNRYLMPHGDYAICINDNENTNVSKHKLLCGLSGTQTITFQVTINGEIGDLLSFYSHMPAFAEKFPFIEASLVAPPLDNTPLLTNKYDTSWITISNNGKSNNYFLVQPEKAPFYGKNGIKESKDILLVQELGYPIIQHENFCFPLIPYANHKLDIEYKDENTLLFEKQIISKVRQNKILEGIRYNNKNIVPLPKKIDKINSFNMTTSSGIIIEVDNTSRWKRIILAQNKNIQMSFDNPDIKLQQAFQSDQMFLIATKELYLSGFRNIMSIDDWEFSVNIGTKNNGYGNYSNVMIIKYLPGKLKDLVTKPKIFSKMCDFNDEEEIVMVSKWLQDYIEDGIKEADKGNQMFNNFREIVTNENWNGILFLKVDINRLPKQLQALKEGLDPDYFYVHHFGIMSSPIDSNSIVINDCSSMFGLINYIDPSYNIDNPNKLLEPSMETDYDFRVLTLKVLFDNSTIKSFSSTAQLTINKLFGCSVDYMGNKGNEYPTILLEGSLQQRKMKNGSTQTSYMLDTIDDSIFYFSNSVIKRVEINKVQLYTAQIKDSQLDNSVLGKFDITGYIDFGVFSNYIEMEDERVFQIYDYLSFGNDYKISHEGNIDKVIYEDIKRKGLEFSGLLINMISADNTDKDVILTMDYSKMSFDLSKSTIRTKQNNLANSLYNDFKLQLEGVLIGDKKQPEEFGFVPVTTDIEQTSLQEGWVGLSFKLKMGTLGNLADKVKLNSNILLAWSSSSTNSIFVGIKLPGISNNSKIVSLQGVIKLSIKDIMIKYMSKQKLYMLVLSDIALGFFGLLKLPPNGSTSFYLFGNPNNCSTSSDLGWYTLYKKNSNVKYLGGD